MSEASRAPGRRPSQGRVGTVVNGKWHIDARIGSGGMATVYAATHRNGHRAALKMLHTPLSRDESIRSRFLREGYVANAVAHPGVVHVEDDGVSEDGAAFLVLELLEGETIEARRMRQGGMLPLVEVLAIADQALDALAAAHEKGIVHRDVKPDNVFMCWNGDVKVLDFGLARMKELQVEATKTGVTIGTPEFMSPEQAQGRRDEVDARSDVWALGATIFTSITGKPVHVATNLHEQLIASATLRPRPVRELAPHVPPSVAIVIDRALELDKKDRWESASEMQRALRAARAPRTESDRVVAESLTLPAASPASLKRGAAAIVPRSGPRPSSGPVASPTTDRTLEFIKPPSSDQTIEDQAPITIQLDELPTSSDVPISPVPHTERLTGTGTRGSGAILQAQSAHAQAIASAQAQAVHQATQHIVAPPRASALPRRYDSTLESSQDPARPGAPPFASAMGSGPYPTAGSGAHPALGSSGGHPALGSSGGHPALSNSGGHPALSKSGGHPALGSSGAHPALGSSGGHPSLASGPYPMLRSTPGSNPSLDASDGKTTLASGTGPPPPLAMNGGVIGPVSLRTRRSSRRVVIVSLLLIVTCAAIGAWVLLHPTFTAGH